MDIEKAEIDWDSVDTESTEHNDCQFHADVIISPKIPLAM